MKNTVQVPDNFVPINTHSLSPNVPELGEALYTVTAFLAGKSQRREDQANKFRLEQSLLSARVAYDIAEHINELHSEDIVNPHEAAMFALGGHIGHGVRRQEGDIHPHGIIGAGVWSELNFPDYGWSTAMKHSFPEGLATLMSPLRDGETLANGIRPGSGRFMGTHVGLVVDQDYFNTSLLPGSWHRALEQDGDVVRQAFFEAAVLDSVFYPVNPGAETMLFDGESLEDGYARMRSIYDMGLIGPLSTEEEISTYVNLIVNPALANKDLDAALESGGADLVAVASSAIGARQAEVADRLYGALEEAGNIGEYNKAHIAMCLEASKARFMGLKARVYEMSGGQVPLVGDNPEAYQAQFEQQKDYAMSAAAELLDQI